MRIRPHSSYCQIKELLYPDNKKPIKNLMSLNYKHIKLLQEKNRIKKEEKNNYVEPIPFKMKEFKDIPSKLNAHTEKWINNEKNITKNLYPDDDINNNRYNKNNNIRPKSSTYRSVNLNPNRDSNMNYKEDPNSKYTLFQKYYKNRLIDENLIPDPALEEKKEKLNKLKDKYDNELKEIRNINNIEERMLEDYEAIKKVKLKAETPTINEKGIILPKSNRNFLEENKTLIKKNYKIIDNNNNKENPFHKEYGKVPNYITNMKIDAEIRKEIEEKMKEEKKLPKNSRLLSEEERLKTLNGLYESQKEIQGLIEKLPITMSTLSSKNKKNELYKKLDEIEEAIKTFSRKKVYVKINA